MIRLKNDKLLRLRDLLGICKDVGKNQRLISLSL
jgi:hypothetical protein